MVGPALPHQLPGDPAAAGRQGWDRYQANACGIDPAPGLHAVEDRHHFTEPGLGGRRAQPRGFLDTASRDRPAAAASSCRVTPKRLISEYLPIYICPCALQRSSTYIYHKMNN